MTIPEILAAILPYQVKHVLLTGGEPLMQRPTPDLARALKAAAYSVTIETHGEVSVETISTVARVIMDIKTPSSGMCRGEFEKNFKFLKESDEVKFVIASEEDYSWARDLVRSGRIPTREILFSPAVPAKDQPGKFPGVQPRWIAERILEDKLPVRMQLQLHKLLWGANVHGV